MRHALTLIAALYLAGCTSGQPLMTSVSVGTETVRGDYRTIATCTYKAIGRDDVRKVDLDNEVTIADVVGTGITQWKAVFRPAAARGTTSVEVFGMQVTGRVGGHEHIMPAVRGCEAQLASGLGKPR